MIALAFVLTFSSIAGVERDEPEPAPLATTATGQRIGPQTRWEPLQQEVESAADGMLGLCSTLILPVSIIPAVGQFIGLAAEWLCVVPAGLIVEQVALQHGDRAPPLGGIYFALGAQKLWELAVSIPAPLLIVRGVQASRDLRAISDYYEFPQAITAGLVILPITAAFAFTRLVADEGGKMMFLNIYDHFDDSRMFDEHAADAASAPIGPRIDGLPGVAMLVTTANGTSAPYSQAYVTPVVGPLLRAKADANLLKAHMRRTGEETLGERKDDLSGMDTTIDTLMNARGCFGALGQVGMGCSAGILTSSLLLWSADRKDAAEGVGTCGFFTAIFAAVFIGLAQVPDTLKPCVVPAAYMLAPVSEKYADPRTDKEVPPPPPDPDYRHMPADDEE